MDLRLIITIYFSIICLSRSDAQINWKVGMQWEYEIVPTSAPGKVSKFSIPKDTIVDNKNCLILLSEHYSCTQRPKRDIIYQDGSKIYYYHREDLTFRLLYDFNAEIGDTIQVRLWDGHDNSFDYVYFLVDSIEYVDYSYISLKRFIYRSRVLIDGNLTGNDFLHEILEGIGSTINLFYWPNNGLCDGLVVRDLICFEHPDYGIYSQNPDECNLTTSFTPSSGEEDSITIFPNPTNQILRIATQLTYREIEIYDLSGRRVLESQPINFIDISGLAKGLYVIKFITASSEQTSKFLVI